MRICIDPGHGGSDPGAVGVLTDEKTLNLAISEYLDYELWERGHDVLMTRRQDRTLGLGARARFANRYNVDLFVSVHCNAAGAASAQGIETWMHPYSQTARPYALSVQDRMMDEFTSHRDRGIKAANYQVLRETWMPAILVECEFISNKKQEKFLMNDCNQRSFGKAIADGIEFAGGIA